MILAIKTDKPKAELCLLDTTGKQIAHHNWLADRQLADTLNQAITKFLNQNHLNYKSLTGLIVFTGSGSFTGLRIGTTVANAIAYAQNVAIVRSAGADWLVTGHLRLTQAKLGHYITPNYDAKPNISKPKY